MIETEASVSYTGQSFTPNLSWEGPRESLVFDEAGVRQGLLNLERPLFVLRVGQRIAFTSEGGVVVRSPENGSQPELLASLPPQLPQNLGDPAFKSLYGLQYAYLGGSMAHGISSENMVIEMGRAGMLGSFGAAGLGPARLEAAIRRIQQEIPDRPYAFNLIHSPAEEAIERRAVELYLEHGVTIVEASAFLDLTPNIIRYRAAGLSLDGQGQVVIKNRVIAKLSRTELAMKFMQPAPEKLLRGLVESGQITAQQAELAARVPVADSVTVEADSGGHTDNRPLVCLLPSIIELRNRLQEKYHFARPVTVGAGGGIGTPASALAALMMGASYLVTGSVNSGCVEAGNSEHTRKLLSQAEMADVIMAPSADMFEMGVKVQLLKRGTLFPMRAQKLYDTYRAYGSLEEIPEAEVQTLEKQIFKKSISSIWDETVAFFKERDPEQITSANANPKKKMALVFRWYLGLSSRWSNSGEKGREMDYQIWCGPAMGSFNEWVKETYLQEPQNRRVVDVALNMLTGAVYLYRLQNLKALGLNLPAHFAQYQPVPLVPAQG
jgi:PfaD family protein